MKPSMQSTWTFVCLSFLAAANAPATAATSAQEKSAEARYVKVKEGGAKLRNLADKDADVLAKPAAGSVLQVHGESAGFLEVSSPTGLDVWVFGEYVKESATPGMLELTANSVRMRPQPSASEKSFALRQTLAKGELVRFLGRNDAKKPMAEDWIQIVSPSSARAWIAVGDTTALAAGEDGGALFAAAERELAAKAPVVLVPGTTAPAKAEGKPEVKVQPAAASGDALANAEKLMQAALASEKPDFKAAKAAFQKIVDAGATGASAATAKQRLEEIAVREELLLLRSAQSQGEEQRQAELERKAAELRELSLHQDPLWGRFQKRGWLEQDGDRYVVRWGAKITAEVSCSAKRYDLARFVGYELGITGLTTRAAGSSGQPERVDVARIEVLSGAGPKR